MSTSAGWYGGRPRRMACSGDARRPPPVPAAWVSSATSRDQAEHANDAADAPHRRHVRRACGCSAAALEFLEAVRRPRHRRLASSRRSIGIVHGRALARRDTRRRDGGLGAVIDQLCAQQRMGARQLGFGKTHAAAEQGRDLLVAQPFDVVHPYDGARQLRQAVPARVPGRCSSASGGSDGLARASVGPRPAAPPSSARRARCQGERRCIRQWRSAICRTQAPKGASPRNCGRCAQQAHHAVLEHVLGGGPAAHHAADQREHRSGRCLIDLALRAAIARRRAAQASSVSGDRKEPAHVTLRMRQPAQKVAGRGD